MEKKVKAVPEGFHTANPYLIVKDGARAIEFYKAAFGAEELFRHPTPDGRVGHAELRIGDTIVMMADEFPEMPGCRSPQTLGGTSFSLYLYLENVDAAFDRAVKAGAQVIKPLADQFYGDRSGALTDPFGHVWGLATHIKDVTPEEIAKGAAKASEAK